jgi:hypothetical protein
VRLPLDCLFQFASICDELGIGLQEWGEHGMGNPTTATCTDGCWSKIESKEKFFSSPDASFVGGAAKVTELEYIESTQNLLI